MQQGTLQSYMTEAGRDGTKRQMNQEITSLLLFLYTTFFMLR